MNIKLLEGIEGLNFGLSKDDFLLQHPENANFELLEEEEELKTEAVFLEEINSTLYFEGDETEMLFTACDTENKDATLFGVNIFEKTEAEIIELMKQHDYNQYDSDIEEWGEKNISFLEAMADFYFIQGKLTSVSWGILIL